MEKLLFKKLLFDCLILFSITLISASIVILVFQAVNFLDVMIEDGRNYRVYINYTLLNFPKIISKILPFVLLFSITYVVAKYELNNELLIFWNFGINKIKLINFFLNFSIILMIIQIIFSVYIVPKSLELSKKIMVNSNVDFFESFIKPKRFNDTIKGLTLFAEDKDENGFLTNIYIKKDNNPNSFQITYAKNGKLVGNEKNKILELYNGKTINKINKKTSVFNFSKSNFSLTNVETNFIKDSKIQETSTITHLKCLNQLYRLNIEILKVSKKIVGNCSNDITNEIFKELYKRFIIPLYIPAIVLISMMLIIKNKEIVNYSYYRTIIFLIGFLLIIFSETSQSFMEKSFLNNLKIFFLPLLFFISLYLPLIYKFQIKLRRYT